MKETIIAIFTVIVGIESSVNLLNLVRKFWNGRSDRH